MISPPPNAIEVLKAEIMRNLHASIAKRGGTGRRPWKLLIEGTWPDWYQSMDGDDPFFTEALKQLVNEGRVAIQVHSWIGWHYLSPRELVDVAESLPDGVAWVTSIP